MANARDESREAPPAKRQKLSSSFTTANPRSNPYLAHMYQDEDSDSGSGGGVSLGNLSGNGHGAVKPANRLDGSSSDLSSVSDLANFPRHATTSRMAMKAEDGPMNPFNGKPLSKRYFDILKVRRDLPVHQQR